MLLLEVAEGGGVGGVGCNRLVTSVGELTLGQFPCQLSPGGDVFSFQCVGSWMGQGGSG